MYIYRTDDEKKAILKQAVELQRQGMTTKDIPAKVGVVLRTLYKIADEFPDFGFQASHRTRHTLVYTADSEETTSEPERPIQPPKRSPDISYRPDLIYENVLKAIGDKINGLDALALFRCIVQQQKAPLPLAQPPKAS